RLHAASEDNSVGLHTEWGGGLCCDWSATSALRRLDAPHAATRVVPVPSAGNKVWRTRPVFAHGASSGSGFGGCHDVGAPQSTLPAPCHCRVPGSPEFSAN